MTEQHQNQNVEPDAGILADDALLNYYTTQARRHYTTGIQAIIKFGECLLEARNSLSAQAWKRFTEDKDLCPVGLSSVSKYIKIAKNPNISNPENWLFFPMGWNVLYEIHQLTDEQFAAGIRPRFISADGITTRIINPDVTGKEIQELRNKKPAQKATPKPQSVTPRPDSSAPDESDSEELELAALVNQENGVEGDVPEAKTDPASNTELDFDSTRAMESEDEPEDDKDDSPGTDAILQTQSSEATIELATTAPADLESEVPPGTTAEPIDFPTGLTYKLMVTIHDSTAEEVAHFKTVIESLLEDALAEYEVDVLC